MVRLASCMSLYTRIQTTFPSGMCSSGPGSESLTSVVYLMMPPALNSFLETRSTWVGVKEASCTRGGPGVHAVLAEVTVEMKDKRPHDINVSQCIFGEVSR